MTSHSDQPVKPPKASPLPTNIQAVSFEKLKRIKSFSSLSVSEMKLLANALSIARFERYEVILRQADFESGIYVLLTGIVRVICELGGKGRVTVALLAPGPITEFFSLPFDYLEFRYVACTDCRIGSLSWTDFRRVTEDGFHATLRKFYENNLEQCYRLLRHYSEFLKLGLRQRVALALLDLCSDFGIEDSRGTLLPFFSCKDIAGLVGASRPRVSEHMVRLEQDGIVLRQGHRLIVHVAKLSKYLNPDCR